MKVLAWGLVICTIVSVLGAIFLIAIDKTVPDSYFAVVSGLAGGLCGIAVGRHMANTEVDPEEKKKPKPRKPKTEEPQ